jgi:DNA-binding beta-propeller fold protein YncE
VIDAKTGMVICTLPVGGKPEFAQADGKGKIYFNVENTSEIMELDEAKAAITKRIKLAPCDGPSGLAIDSQKRRLFAVCGNKLMAVVDPDAVKILATLLIGADSKPNKLYLPAAQADGFDIVVVGR